MAVITPAAVGAGVIILCRQPRGYLIAVSLLVLEVLLAPLILAQTILQLRAREGFTLPEVLGPIIGFVVLAAVLTGILRIVPAAGGPPALSPGPPSRDPTVPRAGARVRSQDTPTEGAPR